MGVKIEPDAYIFAIDFRHAVDTAMLDLEWELMGLSGHTFKTKAGDIVQAISDADNLRGITDKTVYLGFRWYANPTANTMRALLGSGHLKRVNVEDLT